MVKPASRGAEKKSAAWASHQEQARKGFAARVAKRGAKDEPKGRASLPKDSRALGTAVGDAVEGAFVTALVAIEGAKAALLAAQIALRKSRLCLHGPAMEALCVLFVRLRDLKEVSSYARVRIESFGIRVCGN